jgi:hypothetical protein
MIVIWGDSHPFEMIVNCNKEKYLINNGSAEVICNQQALKGKYAFRL